MVSSLLRIGNVRPILQRTTDSNTVVVNLIASTNHHMKWSFSMHCQIISKQRALGSKYKLPRSTSFHSAGPLQASTSVPTEKPLHDWNIMRIDSFTDGTTKPLESFLETSEMIVISGMVYCHLVSVVLNSSLISKRQKALPESSYSRTPSKSCAFPCEYLPPVGPRG